MLKCEEVVKKYRTCTAVNGVNLEIKTGKIYAMLGPNGSGKTTLMKMITGLIKPTSGSITLNGTTIGTATKANIAYMPTESYFYPYMKLNDIANFYEDFYDDFNKDKFHTLLNDMELRATDKAKDMSSGMIAKLKLSVAMARKSEVILLDEPLNGVDIIAREKVINTIIANASEENSIIISSHLVDELEKIIDDAIFIKNGSMILAGDAEQIRQERGKSIVDLYKEIYA